MGKAKLLLLSAFLLSLSFISRAQKEANIWCFGQNVKVDFNSGVPVSGTSQINTIEGTSAMCNRSTGALLFYTDGVTVYAKNNFPMPNGKNLWGHTSTTQSALIVTMPDSKTKYYIFTLDAQAGHYASGKVTSKGLSYSIVDMTLNGGNGDVTVKNQMLVTPATEKMTAARHCNGRDVWLIVHEWNTDAFYAYLVTPAGINPPVISNVGPVFFATPKDTATGSGYGSTRGAMKASPNSKKLALVTPFESRSVQFYDFCNSDGKVSNPIVDNSYQGDSLGEGLYGVAFSPDNSKVYVSDGRDGSIGGKSSVYQYDMNAGGSAAIIASKLQIASDTLEMGALELGPDGKIYVSVAYSGFFYWPNGFLHAINNPNALGAACTFKHQAVILKGGPDPLLGLSDNFGAGKLNSSTHDTIITCLVPGVPVTLTAPPHPAPYCAPISYLWSTTDTTQKIKITSSNTYTVTESNCYFDTINVTLSYLPVAKISRDTTICSGEQVQLNSSGGTSYSWSPSASLDKANVSNPIAKPLTTTQYTVTVTKGPCSVKDSVTITVKPTPVASAGPDTTIFTGVSVQLHGTGSNGIDSWSWNFGDTAGVKSTMQNTSHTYGNPGSYNVKLTVSENGCDFSISKIINVLEDYSFYIPDAFSPNGDLKNETFIGIGSGFDASTFEMYIFDRWGNQIYHTTDYTKPWDGTANGGHKLVENDVYVWKMQVQDNTKHELHKYTGHVTVVK